MTRIRRALLLAALTASIVAGAGMTTAAQAGFGHTARVSLGTVSTMAVAPPTGVAHTLTCNKASTNLTVTWARSTTPQIEAYVVTVTFSDGVVSTAEVGPTATSWNTTNINAFYLTKPASARVTVTARTDYKWTAQSAPTGTIQC
jgi:hypothetical protein